MNKKIRSRFETADCRAAVARKYENMAQTVRKQAEKSSKKLTFDQLSQISEWEVYAASFRVEQARHLLAGAVFSDPFVARAA